MFVRIRLAGAMLLFAAVAYAQIAAPLTPRQLPAPLPPGIFNPQVADPQPTEQNPNTEPEAFPGQHDHAQPPDGWMCHQPPMDLSGDQTHWCNCERSCDEETQVVHEDKKCSTFCHGDHCGCPMANSHRCMPAGQE